MIPIVKDFLAIMGMVFVITSFGMILVWQGDVKKEEVYEYIFWAVWGVTGLALGIYLIVKFLNLIYYSNRN